MDGNWFNESGFARNVVHQIPLNNKERETMESEKIKMYETNRVFNEIKPVLADRVSESSVWINGRRHAKKSDYTSYFETFADAKQHLVGRADSNLLAAFRDVEYCKKRLAEAEKLSEEITNKD